jgi:hypothetical protein
LIKFQLTNNSWLTKSVDVQLTKIDMKIALIERICTIYCLFYDLSTMSTENIEETYKLIYIIIGKMG